MRVGSVSSSSWLVWALGSAGFAALTAIFAKIGVEGIDSDLATLFRTLVIVVVLTVIIFGGTTARMLEILKIRTGVAEDIDSDDEFDTQSVNLHAHATHSPGSRKVGNGAAALPLGDWAGEAFIFTKLILLRG